MSQILLLYIAIEPLLKLMDRVGSRPSSNDSTRDRIFCVTFWGGGALSFGAVAGGIAMYLFFCAFVQQ